MKSDWWSNFIDLQSSQDIEIKRQKLVLYFSSYIGGGILFLFYLQHIASQDSLLTCILLASSIVVLSNAVISHFHPYFGVSCYITGLGVVGLILGLVFTGGHQNTALYWLYPFPLVYFILFDYRKGLVANLLIFSAILFLLYQPDWILAEYQPAEKSRFIASYLVTIFLSFVAEYFRFHSHQELSSINYQRQKQANTDPLTQLPNRRFLDSVFFIGADREPKHYFPMVVVMADIDFFKRVNDTYGHDTGDHVLKHVASLLKSSLRGFDVVARIGGEEFLILLPQTILVDGISVAEKIRIECQNTPFNQFDNLQQVYIDLTVSFGVAEASSAEQLNNAIMAADSKLYLAKEQGRNQVQG